MLRHLRMASATKKPPKLEGQLFGIIQEWCRPLYRYRVPHSSTPRDRVCTCAYPLYTLRSSRRSPYDEPTVYTSAHEAVYVTGAGAPTTSDSPVSSWTLSGGSSPVNTSTPTPAGGGGAALSFLSSLGRLPSLRARWAVRQRRSRQAAVPPATPVAPPAPPPEACYRCNICDGLQGHAEVLDNALPTSGRSTGSGVASTKPASMTPTASPAEWNKEDEGERTTGVAAASPDSSADERYGRTISTDIANTAMEGTKVAELRHLDPFHVEVFGRPSWSALMKRIAREVQAQLTRCGLRKRDLSRYATQASLNSEMSRQTYKLWVRQESRRIRERQTQLTTPVTVTGSSSQKLQLTAASSEKAIVKGKLDTLHTAGYLARYAMAAYGLPFELNYFSSLRELSKLMAEPHRRYVCANSEEQLESMRRMLQGEEPNALLECVTSRCSLRVGQSCWALFLDHATNRVVLTFRGSLTPADIVVDVTEGYANVMLERPSVNEAAATTGTDASQRLCTAIPLGFYESVVEAGAQLLPLLRTIHSQYSSYQLCITGHSLGGIQASLFHILYCGPWRAALHSSSSLLRRTKTPTCPYSLPSAPPPSSAAISSTDTQATTPGAVVHVPFTKTVTCTFGTAPIVERRAAPLLNAWLHQEEQRSGSRLVTFSNGMDVISRLQLRSLQDVFLRQYARPTEESLSSDERAAVDDNGVAAAGVSDQAVPLLTIPGSLYNMTSGTRRRDLLAVPLTATPVREQVVLIPEAALHHHPSFYLRSLNDLLRRYRAKWQSICDDAKTPPTVAATAAAVAVPTDNLLREGRDE
ncbi:hypothetical protein, conserved [Leishmania tarentolae]|uniref:sn-1-specific diacylglycerol lipase n=1 Tax=Leishmania tarentolae TaxID=5689 RepID=A0A640KQX2_LEITA|nr:hypothetical protein, conserved [Leishmania tarentolae]